MNKDEENLELEGEALGAPVKLKLKIKPTKKNKDKLMVVEEVTNLDATYYVVDVLKSNNHYDRDFVLVRRAIKEPKQTT